MEVKTSSQVSKPEYKREKAKDHKPSPVIRIHYLIEIKRVATLDSPNAIPISKGKIIHYTPGGKGFFLGIT